MIRIGLVGVGKIARDQHVPAIAATPGFDLAATADPSGAAVGVAAFASLEAMLERGPALDAVAICTPPRHRAELAARAIAAGLHVLVEKPPAVAPGEVERLASLSHGAGVTLFAAWHSREAAAVTVAGDWLKGRALRSVAIDWREDIRKWHPGQEWILDAGGFGVFDPGINALSIVTAILPGTWRVAEARMVVPAGRDGAIAADLSMVLDQTIPVRATFDFRETGAERWVVAVETDAGRLCLADGGATVTVDGRALPVPEGAGEYPRLYRRFAALVASGAVDADTMPLRIVTDAIACAVREEAPAFRF